jgi:hypothetical protein
MSLHSVPTFHQLKFATKTFISNSLSTLLSFRLLAKISNIFELDTGEEQQKRHRADDNHNSSNSSISNYGFNNCGRPPEKRPHPIDI